MIDQFGGSLCDKAVELAKADGRGEDAVDNVDMEIAEEMVSDKIKACLMLCIVNRKKYKPLKDDLANSYVKGKDCYPKTCEALMGMMHNFRAPRAYYQFDHMRIKDEDCLQFMQDRETSDNLGAKTGEDGAAMVQKGCGRDEKRVRFNCKGKNHCFTCGGTDHWANECPKKCNGNILIQHGAMISQVKSDPRTGGLHRNYLYLDTCSTINQMVNQAYLSGVHVAKEPLRLHTNAGTSVSAKQGYLGSTLFWFDRVGIANVVSLKCLEARHHVSYDSPKDGGASVVYTKNGDVIFKRCPEMGFPSLTLMTFLSQTRAPCWCRLCKGTMKGSQSGTS